MERSPNKKQSLLFFHLYPHIPDFIECWADSIIPTRIAPVIDAPVVVLVDVLPVSFVYTLTIQNMLPLLWELYQSILLPLMDFCLYSIKFQLMREQ